MSNNRFRKKQRKPRKASVPTLKQSAQATSPTSGPGHLRKDLDSPSAATKQAPTVKSELKERVPAVAEPKLEKEQSNFRASSIDKAVWWFVGSVALAIIINHFSERSWSLYIPAFTSCFVLAWKTRACRVVRLILIPLYVLIAFGTHSYVRFESRNADSTLSRARMSASPEVQPVLPKKPAWEPPEIPDGCKTAFVQFGECSWTINLDDLTPDHPFIPPGLGTNPITIHFKNNRLYVQSDIFGFDGVTNSQYTDLIDGPSLTDAKLSLAWDRNFGPNVFEIVNQDTNPVFQVIYHRPNQLAVNGVFAAAQPEGKSLSWLGDGQIGPFILMFVYGTNFEVLSVSETKNLSKTARTALTRYRDYRQFRYPSYNHLGEYAQDK